MNSLEVYGLTKRFGKTTAIKDVHFSIPSGESLAILGPEDSGKTTLMRLVCGLEEADQGRIIINGEDVTSFPASRRRISVIWQNGYSLLPHMDVFENIALPLQHDLTSKEIKGGMGRQRVVVAAQFFHVQDLLTRKVSTLSAGEQLRVAMARGYVKKNQLYIFDEALMHLDTPTRLAARREIAEFHRATRIPFIFMTRDQPEAFALANQIAVINKGEIQQIGTRAELSHSPATLWVAQWLGFPPMNTIHGSLQGTYKEDGIHYRLWSRSLTPLLPAKWSSVLEEEQCQHIFMGIRPEDIVPEWELEEKWHPAFYTTRVEIRASEWYQGKTLAQLQLSHAEDMFMAIFEVPHDQVKIGQVITVGFDPEKFCLFHPRTQRLLQAPHFPPGLRRQTPLPLRSGSLLRNYRAHRNPDSQF